MWEELLRQKGEDPLDPGGYFIINGTERVLISMEDLAPNRVTSNQQEICQEDRSCEDFLAKGWYEKAANSRKAP